MLHQGVKEHICSLSDDELIEYVADTAAGYTPDAVEFARHQIHERGLGDDRVQAIPQSVRVRNSEQASEAQEAAERPLGFLGRLIFFVIGCPGPILALILWERFRERGEHRKIRDMFLFGLVGSSIQAAGLLARRGPDVDACVFICLLLAA